MKGPHSEDMKMELCGKCRIALESEGRSVHLAFAGADRKVTCAVCGCRRYGATYLVSKEIQK